MRIASRLLVPVSCSILFVASALAGCGSSSEAETDSSDVTSAQAGGAGDSCGSRGHGPCGTGLDCIFPVTAACGATDGTTGTCRPRTSEPCSQFVHEPVCGCDGKTYLSACDANGLGMSVRSQGECPSVPDAGPDSSTGGGLGAGCGIRGLGACAPGLFCQFPVSSECGASDKGGGTCTKAPTACPPYIDPVCGCDGKTYSNPCDAAVASMSLRSKDACPAK